MSWQCEPPGVTLNSASPDDSPCPSNGYRRSLSDAAIVLRSGPGPVGLLFSLTQRRWHGLTELTHQGLTAHASSRIRAQLKERVRRLEAHLEAAQRAACVEPPSVRRWCRRRAREPGRSVYSPDGRLLDECAAHLGPSGGRGARPDSRRSPRDASRLSGANSGSQPAGPVIS